ncbi:MAG: acetylglutamate kinase [Phycisphaeraceae bacterium]|nr:acetylglutamate kinase [Phycisphaeraceae bacterium]
MIGPLIIKIGGAGVDDPLSQSPLWHALQQAHDILQGQLILIHGGGRAVDQHLDRLNIKTDRRDGLRITPSDLMPEITAVLAGRVNKALIAAIQTATRGSLPCVGLTLGDGFGSINCERISTPDLGQVGRISSTSPGTGRLFHTLLAARYLPVIATIGLDNHGQLLNINADDAASGIARIMHARNVILLTDVPGILDKSKSLIPQVDATAIDRLIADGTISGGMIPKAKAALAAAQAANIPTTIASWNNPDDLIRLARGHQIGTQVLPSPVPPTLPSPPIVPSPPTVPSPCGRFGPQGDASPPNRAETTRRP